MYHAPGHRAVRLRERREAGEYRATNRALEFFLQPGVVKR